MKNNWETVLKANAKGKQMLADAIVEIYSLDALEKEWVAAHGYSPELFYQGIIDFIKSGTPLKQAIEEERESARLLAQQDKAAGGKRPSKPMMTMEQYDKDRMNEANQSYNQVMPQQGQPQGQQQRPQ